MDRNLSIHISDRSHMNITLNVYNCGARSMEMGQSFQLDHYALYYISEGSGTVTAFQTTHKLKAGQGFAVFPNTQTVLKADPGKSLNVIWVAFSGYRVDQYLMRAKISAFNPVFEDTPERELEKILELMLQAAVRPANRYCPIVAQLYLAFAFLLEHVNEEPKLVQAPPEMYLLKALDFIDIYYQDGISVEDVAEGVGLNRKALYTVFKQLTGFSTKDYLIYSRMSKAPVMLTETVLPIETVANSVGYHDQFHFSKEFKKNVGHSPSEYRKLAAVDPEVQYKAPIDAGRQQFPSAEGSAPPKF